MRQSPISESRSLCRSGLYAMSRLTIIAAESGNRVDWQKLFEASAHPVVNFEADVALQPSGRNAR
ncbi:hypothetical protein REMIM1_CH00915 [Rhizobium etli bv. mimosae str. Mim1]|nr:hypothetical protein REMIM1_CH00915 [Rhizobium etli bv. mimosae str. Mim1]